MSEEKSLRERIREKAILRANYLTEVQSYLEKRVMEEILIPYLREKGIDAKDVPRIKWGSPIEVNLLVAVSDVLALLDWAADKLVEGRSYYQWLADERPIPAPKYICIPVENFETVFGALRVLGGNDEK